MSNCEGSKQFLTLYFFQNGLCFKPEKVLARKNDLEKTIKKEGKNCFYRGKCIYSLTGECISSLSKISDNCAYVLVKPKDSFKPLEYSKSFADFKKSIKTHRSVMDQNSSCRKKSSCDNRKCQSSPAIPASCRKCSNHCVKFVPCEEEESEEEECPCDPLPSDECHSYSRKKKKKQPEQPKDVKKGFFAKCCPCCVNAKPSVCPSQPMIECGFGKMTQTTTEDFKCSIARMKRAKAEERKRKKMYRQNETRRKECDDKPSFCPRDKEDIICEDPKITKKLEKERNKFFQKRKAMEKRISKALEKKYAKLNRDC